jgi:nucleoside-diphosphate-sugar epimerase
MSLGRVAITGPTGFVGKALIPSLTAAGWDIVPAGRAQVGEIGPVTDWAAYFSGLGQGVKSVVHLAARAHVMNDSAADPLMEYLRVNAHGTCHLAREAARAGVRRLIFVSSVKVMGEETKEPYSETMAPAPVDPYGVSKLEAEKELGEIARHTGLEVIVLRPPLVYGPGVRANFLALIRGVSRGVPLPLGRVSNRRSMIYVGNLCDAIRAALSSKATPSRLEAYFVSDGASISTPQLIRKISGALERKPRLLPVPQAALRLGGALTGKSMAVHRLLSSLEVDDAKIRRELAWTPPFTLEDGLRETVKWFRTL